MIITNLVLNLIQNLNENSYKEQLNYTRTKIHRFALENGLEVHILSNSSFKESEALLSVDAGSIYDPDEIPGLAHLVEHLLFCRSKSYKSSRNWNDFHKKKDVLFNGITSLERTNFHLRDKDEDFEISLEFFIKEIAKPVFRKDNFPHIIGLIENEWLSYVSDSGSKILKLIIFFTDETFPESRFTIGNRKTLNTINLFYKIKEFHSDYFKPNRMKLFIKSKLPIEKLKDLTKKIEFFPKEVQPDSHFHTAKKMKVEPHKINFLFDYPVDIKFKKNYRGKIIKFYDKETKNSVHFYFRFPSNIKELTSIHLDYLEESLSQHVKSEFSSISYVQDMKIKQVISLRQKEFTIELNLREENEEKTNEIISIVYEYFQNLRPDNFFFEEVKNKAIVKYKNATNDPKLLEIYSEYIFLYPKYEFGEFETYVEFNPKVFQDLFKMLADIDNWIVFVPTTDINLSNSLPNFPFVFGNPIPIVLNSSAKESFKTRKLTKYKKLSEAKMNSEFKNTSLPKIKNFKRYNGECTLINETNVFGEYCVIVLNFVSPSLEWKNYSNELFNFALLKKIKNLCLEKNIDCEINSMRNFLFDNNFILKIKKHLIPKFFEIFTNQVKNFTLGNSEIIEAKKIAIADLNLFQQSGLSDLSKILFPYIIKNIDFPLKLENNIQIDNNVTVQFNENYHLIITGTGNITESEVLQIFKKLESNGTRENYDQLNLKDLNSSVNIPESDYKSLFLAYHVSAESRIREFAMANFLRSIFSEYLSKLLEQKYGFLYEIQVEYTYIRQQVFLTFALKTLKNTDLIKDQIKMIMKEYLDIIDKIPDEEFKLFKIKALRSFKWKIDTQENISLFALLSTLIGIYDDHLQFSVKKSINSISKEELKKLNCKFLIEPFAIHGTNNSA